MKISPVWLPRWGLLTSALFAVVSTLTAAPGEPDPSYDVRCVTSGLVSSLAQQGDGKWLVGGIFESVNGMPRRSIARLHAAGIVDSSLNLAGGSFDWIGALAVQTDGRILVSGSFYEFPGATPLPLVRLHPDGSRDLSFVTPPLGGFSSPSINALAAYSDGKILVGGSFTSINGQPRTNLARLNANGSLDPNFTMSADAVVQTIEPDGVDAWLVGGYFRNLGGTLRACLARLVGNALDPAFVPPSFPSNAGIRVIQRMADSRIVYAGNVNGVTSSGLIGRLHAHGTADTTFNPLALINGGVESLAVLADGSILAGTVFQSLFPPQSGRLLKFQSSGTLAPFPFSETDQIIRQMSNRADGSVLLGGTFDRLADRSRFGLALMHADGTLDLDFHPDVTGSGLVKTIRPISGGRWAVGGEFGGIISPGSRGAHRHIGRLLSSGEPDEGFTSGLSIAQISKVNAVAEQTDGYLLVGGTATTDPRIYRLNPDGSHDATFTTTVSGGNSLHSVVLQPDGKILIGGNFTHVNGTSRNGPARLFPSGSLDASFGAGPLGTTYALAYLQGGKIAAVGANYAVRLQPDGKPDPSFNSTPLINGIVHAVAALPGQRLLIAGTFTTINGQPASRIARLLPDGNLDPQFTSGTGADGPVLGITTRRDGEIFLTGPFSGSMAFPAKGSPSSARMECFVRGLIHDSTRRDSAKQSRWSPTVRFWWEDYFLQ